VAAGRQLLAGPARGGTERTRDSERFQTADERTHGGRLARARPPGEYDQAVTLEKGGYRITLLAGKGAGADAAHQALCLRWRELQRTDRWRGE